MKFEGIAPYLSDPLILIGFFLFLGFLVIRLFAKKIPVFGEQLGFRIVRIVLLYGFVLGLLLTVLGFGLKFSEQLREQEKLRQTQVNVINMLIQELEKNKNMLHELQSNLGEIDNAVSTTATVVRTKGISILVTMFSATPEEVADEKFNSFETANAAIEAIRNKGLVNQQLEVSKYLAATEAILKTIATTRTVLTDLGDFESKHYLVDSTIVNQYLPDYKNFNLFDIASVQGLYSRTTNERNQYRIVAQYSVDYTQSFEKLWGNGNNRHLNPAWLAEVYSKENLSYSVRKSYTVELAQLIDELGKKILELKNTKVS